MRNNSITSFAKAAQGLSKNPLGIIALFIVLVYAMASLVLGYTAKDLAEGDRHILVLFLIGFPNVVLGAFVWLVSCHHNKLYAPSDYRDEKNFLRTLTPEEQRSRLQQDATALEVQSPSESASHLAIAVEGEKPTKSGYQPSRVEYSMVLALAEDLALRQLESDLGFAIRRNVALNTSREYVTFDGVTRDIRGIIAIETKFLLHHKDRPRHIRRIREIAVKMKEPLQALEKDSGDCIGQFIIVGITEGPLKDYPSAEAFESAIGLDAPPIEVRLMAFDDLKKRFGIE